MLASAVAVACASTSDNAIAPGFEGAPGVERVLLAPLNLTVGLQPELEDGVEPVDAQILAYLEQHGRRAERLPLRDARRLWDESVAELSKSGSEPAFAAAAERFTRKLGEAREFQVLVMPSLLLRRVSVHVRTAEWDGVERRVRVVNAPRLRAGRNDSALANGLVHAGVRADLPASSLHVMIFDREGRQVFDGRGGLEILHEIDLADALEREQFDIRRRSDLFQDLATLREAVQVAFTPFLDGPREP